MTDIQDINQLEERIVELENSWKRALADYKNLEKRTAEEKADFAEFANLMLLLKLVPILDNLELMSAHTKDAGLDMIIKDFRKVFEEEGIVELETGNQIFDPLTMDAIEMLETNAENEGKVLETVRKGYMFKSKKVLRPATVKVGKRVEEKEN